MTPLDRFTRVALACGVAAPLLYFGAQLAAAPFYPGYDFLTQAASLLGSDLSDRPEVLNAGAMATGAALGFAAVGFFRALRGAGASLATAAIVALAVASMGVGSFWAGVFPLPDPRHDAGPIKAGMFVVPAAMLVALWNRAGPGARIYFAANVAAFVLLVPVMSGVAGIDTSGFQGLVQRVAALVLFAPVGVGAACLRRRLTVESGFGYARERRAGRHPSAERTEST